MSNGGIVGAAAVPHAPQFFTLPDTEDHEQVARVEQTMRGIGEDLRALEPDAVVIIANDHLQNFLLHCSPSFTIHRGPRVSGSFAGRDFSWPVASDIATGLVRQVQRQGFDPAVSLSAPIGYEFGIPLTFLGFGPDTPLIPIYVNSYVPPQPTGDRCYAFGRALATAAELLDVRLCVIASGGLSHYPGTERYASPDLHTDEYLLQHMRAGNLRVLLEFDDTGLDRTGNVEARSWLILAGALAERVPGVVRFEPSWHHNYAIAGWADGAPAAEDAPHYPIPRADQLAIYQALYALRTSHDACADFLSDAERFADRYDLRPDERAALLRLDEAALRDLGVHPLLAFLARLEVDLARSASGPAAAAQDDGPAHVGS